MNKIKLGILSLVLAMGFSLNAQAFEEGKSYLSLSYGYALFNPTTLFSDYSDLEGFNTKSIGPVGLSYEYALSDKLGFGVSLGYSERSISWKETYDYEYKNTKVTANARLNVHMGEHDKFDPYFGFGLGFKSSNWKLTTEDENFSDLSFKGIPVSMEARLGARYFFIPNLGIFGELGIGHGFAHLGLVGKF